MHFNSFFKVLKSVCQCSKPLYTQNAVLTSALETTSFHIGCAKFYILSLKTCFK